MADRARKGGEIGMNGQHYAGGQFLPHTTLPKQPPAVRRQGTRKQEVLPYRWELPPTETARSIFHMLAGCWATLDRANMQLADTAPARFLAMHGEIVFGWHYRELIALFNQGERWFEPKGE